MEFNRLFISVWLDLISDESAEIIPAMECRLSSDIVIFWSIGKAVQK